MNKNFLLIPTHTDTGFDKNLCILYFQSSPDVSCHLQELLNHSCKLFNMLHFIQFHFDIIIHLVFHLSFKNILTYTFSFELWLSHFQFCTKNWHFSFPPLILCFILPYHSRLRQLLQRTFMGMVRESRVPSLLLCWPTHRLTTA